MVIENNIPKTETVYELKEKYEIPSFEEFMKTYKSDGSLNYADLSGGSVGDMKGYGPCSWSNPNCECYISAAEGRYVPLYLVCPAPKDRYPWCKDKEPGMWTHASNNCGGRRYINTSLMLKCMKCGRVNHVRESSFKCSTHQDDAYAKASKSEFGNALTGLNNLWKNKSPVVRAYVEKMIEKQLEEEGFYYE